MATLAAINPVARLAAAAAVLLAVVAAPAFAGGPTMVIGAAEDVVKQDTVVAAKAKLDLLRLAGFDAVRVTSIWAPGLRAPIAVDQRRLAAVSGAAQLTGMKVYVAIFNAGSATTPLTDKQQADFAAYAAAVARKNQGITNFVVGNEPNINRFWLPQFNPDGTDAAAPAYESLLAKTYDALKLVSPSIQVIGGSVSPRGGDRPAGGRPTHSPTTFITDLIAAYKASGRLQPIMDAFNMHPYEDNSSLPPSFAHPRTTTIAIADYGKLEGLLAGFDGTNQPGSALPIVYGEFGVESTPPASKADLYTGTEPATTKPVDEATQGSYYHDALALAFCQPNVRAFFVFHAFDEPALDRFQSGLYYPDFSPKSDLPVFQAAARDARGGVLAKCPGLKLTPTGTVVYPSGKALGKVPLKLTITCDIDCNVWARLAKMPKNSTTLSVRTALKAGVPTKVVFPARKVAPGPYRFTVRLTAPLNTGPPAQLQSDPIVIPSASR
jgi:hypothetical protein